MHDNRLPKKNLTAGNSGRGRPRRRYLIQTKGIYIMMIYDDDDDDPLVKQRTHKFRPRQAKAKIVPQNTS